MYCTKKYDRISSSGLTDMAKIAKSRVERKQWCGFCYPRKSTTRWKNDRNRPSGSKVMAKSVF